MSWKKVRSGQVRCKLPDLFQRFGEQSHSQKINAFTIQTYQLIICRDSDPFRAVFSKLLLYRISQAPVFLAPPSLSSCYQKSAAHRERWRFDEDKIPLKDSGKHITLTLVKA